MLDRESIRRIQIVSPRHDENRRDTSKKVVEKKVRAE